MGSTLKNGYRPFGSHAFKWTLVYATLTMSLFIYSSAQVAKIKSDEREDLKVLATGVAAALAARKVNFEFKMSS